MVQDVVEHLRIDNWGDDCPPIHFPGRRVFVFAEAEQFAVFVDPYTGCSFFSEDERKFPCAGCCDANDAFLR